jgi:endonuclease G, mitochondrial
MEPDVGAAAPTAASGTTGSSEAREATGFDPEFLGVAAIMPRMDDAQAAASVELAYEHFTVMLDTVRRFAGVTAVNIDGARLVKVPRDDRWLFDERIPAELQAGPEVYADNDLDRGHLVRRNDPVWGDPSVAARANTDTFMFTNAAPQASGFNQSRELWLGLEDHVLEHARVHKLKLSVFTGPVFAADDPPYRGIRIPLKFWKVAAWSTGETLATTGFVVDQSPLVDIDLLPRELGAPPPLGPFRTFQVRVADIAELTGLSMPELIAAENLPRGVPAWRQLETADDILV